MRHGVPRRFADELIEPARARPPQLEAVVQAHGEAGAHQAEELAIRQEARGLHAGDAALQDDGQRGSLRGGGGDRRHADQGQEREARPHLKSGGRVAA